MQEVGAPLAGEMSGHMFFADNWYGFDDAIYGSARFVALFSAQDKPMTGLPGWPASFATREINIPLPGQRQNSPSSRRSRAPFSAPLLRHH